LHSKFEPAEQRARLEPAIALYLIIAWHVLFLTRLGHDYPERSCDTVFDEAEWKAVDLGMRCWPLLQTRKARR
jgi:hypothetical protein